MKKVLFIGLLGVLGVVKAQTWKSEDQYIQKFAPYAVEEMEKYKIPASITLAQGLLETAGGQSRLAQEGKNHFGIKCKEDWNPRYAYILIDKIERYKLYEFDNTNKNEVYYAILKMYPSLNQDAVFMAQLSQNRQNEKVAPPTIRVDYSQDSYAKQQSKVSEMVDAKTKAELLKSILVKNHPNGDLKFFVMPVDADVADIAKKFGISEKRLMKYNELENSKLTKNDIIFLEGKNSSGNKETYKAGIGETMHDIAQKFGIKLKKLYSKNRMEAGEEPRAGQVIYLQSKKPRS